MISNIKSDRDIYKRNLESALSECILWRTKDSISMAKNNVLTLKLADLERYRENDTKTIKMLKKRNEDLNQLLLERSVTQIKVVTEVKDSIVYVDSSAYKTKHFKWSDPWVDVKGKLIDDSVDLSVESRDSLVVGVTTKYKRFLGFLWRTKKIEEQNVYATSKNPHTVIQNVECINVNNN